MGMTTLLTLTAMFSSVSSKYVFINYSCYHVFSRVTIQDDVKDYLQFIHMWLLCHLVTFNLHKIPICPLYCLVR